MRVQMGKLAWDQRPRVPAAQPSSRGDPTPNQMLHLPSGQEVAGEEDAGPRRSVAANLQSTG